MNKTFHIALNTFRESVRDKVLYVIAFFGVLMIIASQGLGWVSVGEEAQIVKHFSLAVTSFFGALIAVFVGTGLIYKEIDKRTIYTVLSKPIHRWQFVLGKFAGLMMVLACVMIGMGVIASLFVIYTGASVEPIYIQAMALIFFELMVVTALAIFFSSVSSPVLAAIFTFCGYLIGQVTPSLLSLIYFEPSDTPVAQNTGEHLTDIVSESHWLLKPVGQFLYHVLPNLTHFHLRNRVVYGPELQPGEFGYAVLYALCYSAAVMVVAIILFDRKKF